MATEVDGMNDGANTDGPAIVEVSGSPAAEADFDPLPFDAAAARTFGRVAADLRRAGRKPVARAYDAMIAAIALANDLPVHTCDPSHFVGIDGLIVVEVPHPDH